MARSRRPDVIEIWVEPLDDVTARLTGERHTPTRPHMAAPIGGITVGPVASRLPVYEEVLRDGERGLLFEPREADVLAAQLSRLIDDTDLFGWVASGQLRVHISNRYPLAEAAQAHEDLEARRTTGKVLLIP